MASRHGPPTRFKPKGHGLGPSEAPLAEPVVCDLGRAAVLLDCEPGQLADAVTAAGLDSWGSHASGAAVYRWPELCQAAARAGIPTPTTRPTMADWRHQREAKREREVQRKRSKAGPS
jgi:hypothetical protein